MLYDHKHDLHILQYSGLLLDGFDFDKFSNDPQLNDIKYGQSTIALNAFFL